MVAIAFATLFALAFVMSMELGQTAAEIVRRATKGGFKDGLMVALGAALAEVLFLILTATGAILFLSNTSLLPFVWLVGGIVTLYLGAKGLWLHRQKLPDAPQDASASYRWSFGAGFALNFIHPLNILWWAGTLGPIMVSTIHSHGYAAGIVAGLGVPAGALAWWIILSIVVSYAKHSLPHSFTRTVNLISSVGLIVFGAYFLYRAFSSLFM